MHILDVHENALKQLNLLKGLKFKINRVTLAKLYKSLVRPLMEYTDVVWDGCPGSVIVICLNLSSMNQLKRSLVLWGYYSRRRLLDVLAWEDLKIRRSMHKLILFFKIINKLTPDYLSDLLPPTI